MHSDYQIISSIIDLEVKEIDLNDDWVSVIIKKNNNKIVIYHMFLIIDAFHLFVMLLGLNLVHFY